MQNEITDCIHTEEIYQIIGIEHIALGFTHFSVSL